MGRNMTRNTTKYHQYLRSDRWGLKRLCVLGRAGYRCERCRQYGYLEIHHLTYANLFNEPIEDLLALCPVCHKDADAEREYEKGLRTYARKKYGELYSLVIRWGDLVQEYDEWLEKQGWWWGKQLAQSEWKSDE